MRTEESLESEVGNRINVANDVLKYKKRNKGKTKMHYNLIKYKKKGIYKILEDISEHVTLVQLMYSLGNMNHAINFVGYWIFDSNCKEALVLNKESLDMICAPSVGE